MIIYLHLWKEVKVIKNRFIYPFLVLFILLTACSSKVGNTVPEISNITTNFPIKDGWYVIPENSSELEISLEATNVESILYWVVSTGTEAWGERELIGYDINGEDGWNLTWNIAERSLHHRVAIQALGSDGITIANETILITHE